METKDQKRYFSGRSLGQALLVAAEDLGIAPDRIAYELLGGRHTSLKGTRRTVISVDPARPERPVVTPEPKVVAPPQAPTRIPRAEDSPRQGQRQRDDRPASRPMQLREELSALELAALEGMELLLPLAGLELDVHVEEGAGGVAVDLTGPDRRIGTGRHGEVLRAFEYLLPRVMGQEVEVRVDSGRFRARQEEELVERARMAAREARASGEPQWLDPLSPAERRVVHLAILDCEGVASASDGEGFLKRIRIFPGEAEAGGASADVSRET